MLPGNFASPCTANFKYFQLYSLNLAPFPLLNPVPYVSERDGRVACTVRAAGRGNTQPFHSLSEKTETLFAWYLRGTINVLVA